MQAQLALGLSGDEIGELAWWCNEAHGALGNLHALPLHGRVEPSRSTDPDDPLAEYARIKAAERERPILGAFYLMPPASVRVIRLILTREGDRSLHGTPPEFWKPFRELRRVVEETPEAITRAQEQGYTPREVVLRALLGKTRDLAFQAEVHRSAMEMARAAGHAYREAVRRMNGADPEAERFYLDAAAAAQ